MSSTIDFATRYLGGIVAAFLASHRDITIELEATDRLVDLIEDNFDDHLAKALNPPPWQR